MTQPSGHERSRLQLIGKIPICETCHVRCSACDQLGQCCLTTARMIEVPREEEARGDDLVIAPSRQAEFEEEEVSYG